MKSRVLKVALLFAALFLVLIGASACSEEHVPAEETDRSFVITDYHVEMHVARDRVIDVTERITVVYAYPKHGMIRDFDLTGGVRYTHLSATRDGAALPVSCEYDVSSMLSFYLGTERETLAADRPYLYEIAYTMTVPALSDRTYLPLDVLGFDWYTDVENFSATLTLPSGLAAYEVFSGRYQTTSNDEAVAVAAEGNVVTLRAADVGPHRGITLDLSFEKGVLTGPPVDVSWLWALGAVAAYLCCLVLVKCFALKKPVLTTTVGFTAPDEMDPLLMGKLIDGKIDSEDLGALIFWFAAHDYLTIDLTADPDDPTLIRTHKPTDGLPPYLATFCQGLFGAGTTVTVDSLKNTFYRTADAVKAQVNARCGSFYSGKSKAVLGVFAALAVLLFGGFSWLYGLLTVNLRYVALPPLIFALIACAVSAAISVTASMRAYKWSAKKVWALRIAGLALGALPVLLALLFYPVSMSRYLVAALVFASDVAGMVCGFLLIHSEKYTERLGLILGFKEFILYTEKDKIAVMLEDDPALYYRVLPYAQVLGVTDAWTEKFKGLDLRPPAYVRGDSFDVVLSAMMWNRIFIRLSGTMGHSFVSRPSNTGGGHSSGGFGGGFGGGGFGGGGGRSF